VVWLRKNAGGFVPLRIKRSLDRYVEAGTEPGGFIQAVIQNNFRLAWERADSCSRENLLAIVGATRIAMSERAKLEGK